jgi:hypothetical protein
MAVFEVEKKEVIRVANKYKKISLDIAGQAKAIKVLISDAYKSDLRWILELVCNGIDACKEVNKPVDVTLEYAEGSWMTGEPVIIVEDKGSGMSEKIIDKIYTVFMASTSQKRKNAIGAWGIGSKSPLKYADQFYLETVYGGIKARYVVGEDEDSNYGLNFLSSEPTDEESGTKVIVPVNKKDKNKFEEFVYSEFALLKSVTVKGLNYEQPEIVYENDLCYIVKFNYNNFKYDNYHQLSLGGVLYNIDYKHSKVTSDFRNHVQRYYEEYKIILKFDIGELKPTISREDLDMGYKDSKELIESRFKSAVESIQKYVDDTYNYDKYEDIEIEDNWVWNNISQINEPESYVIRKNIVNCLYKVVPYKKNYSAAVNSKCIRRKHHIIDGILKFHTPTHWCEEAIADIKPSKLNTIADSDSAILSLKDIKNKDKVKKWIEYLDIPNVNEEEETTIVEKVEKVNTVFGRELKISNYGVKYVNSDYREYQLSNTSYIYGYSEDTDVLKYVAAILKVGNYGNFYFKDYTGIVKLSKANLSHFESLGAKMTYWKDIDQSKFKLVYNHILLNDLYSWNHFDFMQGIGKSLSKVKKLTDYLETYYEVRYFESRYGSYGYESVTEFDLKNWLSTVTTKDDKADKYFAETIKLYNEKYKELDIDFSRTINSTQYSDKLTKLIKYYDKL